MSLWRAKMPSNIALIKYMGKKDHQLNIPSNSSLSWTLGHLQTEVVVEKSDQAQDSWSLLNTDFPFEMSEKGLTKFLNHAERVKSFFGLNQSFKISSGNNFPADCGIASSASSFAALTEALCQAGQELTGKEISIEEKANLSSQGSGSSCRSFLSDFVIWNESGVESFEASYTDLLHAVVLIESEKKSVSSSEAHKRVQSSELFKAREHNTEARIEGLKEALTSNDWKKAYEISWAEFWEMHALFETSQPPFGYFSADSFQLLQDLREDWNHNEDGPLVTMDAGPNIHLLWRADQKSQALQFLKSKVSDKWKFLTNIKGGVEVV